MNLYEINQMLPKTSHQDKYLSIEDISKVKMMIEKASVRYPEKLKEEIRYIHRRAEQRILYIRYMTEQYRKGVIKSKVMDESYLPEKTIRMKAMNTTSLIRSHRQALKRYPDAFDFPEFYYHADSNIEVNLRGMKFPARSIQLDDGSIELIVWRAEIDELNAAVRRSQEAWKIENDEKYGQLQEVAQNGSDVLKMIARGLPDMDDRQIGQLYAAYQRIEKMKRQIEAEEEKMKELFS